MSQVLQGLNGYRQSLGQRQILLQGRECGEDIDGSRRKNIENCIVCTDSSVGHTSASNAKIPNIFMKIDDGKSERSLLNSLCFKKYAEINVTCDII